MNKFTKVLALSAFGLTGIYASGVCTSTGGGVANGGQALVIYNSLSSGGDFNNITMSNGVTLAQDTLGTCTIGSITFSNFQVSGVGPFNLNTPFFFEAQIDPTAGIDFTYTNLNGADIELEFEVSPGVTVAILNNGTSTSVTENICSNNPGLPGTTCTSLLPGGTLNSNSLNPSVIGAVTPNSVDWVLKDITGGSDVNQVFGPEPMTMSLMGAGLLGLGLIGRKLRRRK